MRGGGAEVTRTAGAGHGDAWGWGGAPETTAPAGLGGFGGLHGPQLSFKASKPEAFLAQGRWSSSPPRRASGWEPLGSTPETAAAAKSLQSCPTLCDPIDGRQPTRLPRPWDSPGKNSGVGCHFLLQCRRAGFNSVSLTPTLSPTHTGSNLEAQSGCQSALSPSRATVETGFLVSGARKIWARILAPATTGCVTLTLSILLRNREIKKKKKKKRPRQPGALLENTCEGSATLFHKQRTFYGFFPTPTSIFTRSRLPFVGNLTYRNSLDMCERWSQVGGTGFEMER